MGSVFRNVSPEELQAHLRYVASGALPSKHATLLLGNPVIEVPVLHESFVRISDRLILALRSGSIGRSALDEFIEALRSTGQQFKVRRSAKLKLVSQCLPYWSVSDTTFPAQAVSVLRNLYDILGRTWPPSITVSYPTFDAADELPGTRDRDLAGEAGRAIGRAVGRILGG
jgi:hypothetical protein